MLLATRKPISIKELKLLDLVMTGEGAQMMKSDRRTFVSWAEKLGIKPVATLKGGKLVYKRDDAERVVKAYKAFQTSKGDK